MLKRYEMVSERRCGEAWQELQQDPLGDWCYYEDVAALEAERDRLKARLAEIEAQRCEKCEHHQPLLPSYKDQRVECKIWRNQLFPRDHSCRAWAAKED